ncbi:hypothetical protein BOTBODRAFT_172778 [Botryobasidium botryosum FD-172 SS1]|uniref:Amine oxidase domain-containing protein n=1 Tax=Botryobasidium botryosum (strain FD-172 SS1) TaxID=930990 RepID=A0A067MLM4_BOTB1|nr:hypothetical protein BOTBODRAFT_172778 [Botryobasidium botryosum FD-172 SS1]
MAASDSHSWHTKFAYEYAIEYQKEQVAPYLTRGLQHTPIDPPDLSPIPHPAPIIGGSVKPAKDLHVGILGAGPAGLYTAMILQDLGISYEILEASTRVGGRVHTHHFENAGNNNTWNYFDLGAMRFPEIPLMDRVFDLMRVRLRLGDQNKLVPYEMHNDDEVLLFNTRRHSRRDFNSSGVGADLFRDAKTNGGTVPVAPVDFVKGGYAKWVSECTGPFKEALATPGNWDIAWAQLMKYDHHSVRSFMATKILDKAINLDKEAYPHLAINWLERMNNASSGAFDAVGLSQMVLGDLEFGFPTSANGQELVGKEGWKWHCVKGGSQVIPQEMLARLETKPTFSSRAIKITPTQDDRPIRVTTTNHKVASGPQHRDFDYAISTMSMAATRLVDLDDVNLTYAQRESMRSLTYDTAIKIGLKFKTRWWQDRFGIKGGTTITDRILRQVVYPSYGMNDPDADAVLIASYCWGNDALRLGSLMSGSNSADEKMLVDLVLRELTILHKLEPGFLHEQLVDFYAKNWYADPFTGGAYASFGPGQFKLLYPAWNEPAAGGRLIFAGEALSECHGWIEGALRSGYWAVYKLLRAAKLYPELAKLRRNWGLKGQYENDGALYGMMDREVLYGAIFSTTEDYDKVRSCDGFLDSLETPSKPWDKL